jgi:hypothetical protein
MARYRRLPYLDNIEFEIDNIHYMLPAVFFPVNRVAKTSIGSRSQ